MKKIFLLLPFLSLSIFAMHEDRLKHCLTLMREQRKLFPQLDGILAEDIAHTALFNKLKNFERDTVLSYLFNNTTRLHGVLPTTCVVIKAVKNLYDIENTLPRPDENGLFDLNALQKWEDYSRLTGLGNYWNGNYLLLKNKAGINDQAPGDTYGALPPLFDEERKEGKIL
jgi:hypothetical protein